MTNEINVNNLQVFVEALNKLPDYIQNNEVDMRSTNEPFCHTTGCHAGLIYIVADDIPELESLYLENHNYDFSKWSKTLEEFLGFDDKYELRDWAYDNPKLWGNDHGNLMFSTGKAFGQTTNTFKHSVIINHWTKVLLRVEESNNKGEV